MSSFGALLTAYRRRADLSMNQLARRSGVDPSHISRLERGQRNPPQAGLLRALMDALDLENAERQELALWAAGALDRVPALDAVWHEATMRAANAILAACPCGGCVRLRTAREEAG